MSTVISNAISSYGPWLFQQGTNEPLTKAAHEQKWRVKRFQVQNNPTLHVTNRSIPAQGKS